MDFSGATNKVAGFPKKKRKFSGRSAPTTKLVPNGRFESWRAEN
jgi:hypothetical protein